MVVLLPMHLLRATVERCYRFCKFFFMALKLIFISVGTLIRKNCWSCSSEALHVVLMQSMHLSRATVERCYWFCNFFILALKLIFILVDPLIRKIAEVVAKKPHTWSYCSQFISHEELWSGFYFPISLKMSLAQPLRSMEIPIAPR